MSTSSCQDDSRKIVEEREKEVYSKSKEFFRLIVQNMCLPEGMTGHFDIAFHIDRQKIIAKALIDLGKELSDGGPSTEYTSGETDRETSPG